MTRTYILAIAAAIGFGSAVFSQDSYAISPQCHQQWLDCLTSFPDDQYGICEEVLRFCEAGEITPL